MPEQQLQQLLSEIETAKQISVSPLTLQQWRHHKRYGLPFVRVGRLIRYRQIDIDNWVASRTVAASEPRAFVAQRKARKERGSALKSAVKAASQSQKLKTRRHRS
jgi:predicted DNA-binding transcriptional regulator AlpA